MEEFENPPGQALPLDDATRLQLAPLELHDAYQSALKEIEAARSRGKQATHYRKHDGRRNRNNELIYYDVPKPEFAALIDKVNDIAAQISNDIDERLRAGNLLAWGRWNNSPYWIRVGRTHIERDFLGFEDIFISEAKPNLPPRVSNNGVMHPVLRSEARPETMQGKETQETKAQKKLDDVPPELRAELVQGKRGAKTKIEKWVANEASVPHTSVEKALRSQWPDLEKKWGKENAERG
jgi:hypothetical protein